MVSPTVTAYETAVQFTLLGDLMRMWHRVGWEPTMAMLQEYNDRRHQLDRHLGSTPRAWTRAEWEEIVRQRLIAQDPPHLIDGL